MGFVFELEEGRDYHDITPSKVIFSLLRTILGKQRGNILPKSIHEYLQYLDKRNIDIDSLTIEHISDIRINGLTLVGILISEGYQYLADELLRADGMIPDEFDILMGKILFQGGDETTKNYVSSIIQTEDVNTIPPDSTEPLLHFLVTQYIYHPEGATLLKENIIDELAHFPEIELSTPDMDGRSIFDVIAQYQSEQDEYREKLGSSEGLLASQRKATKMLALLERARTFHGSRLVRERMTQNSVDNILLRYREEVDPSRGFSVRA